jgi:hypothetical protein
MGIALTLVRVGLLTDSAEIFGFGRELAWAIPDLSREGAEPDLLAGMGGAILGLLALNRLLENEIFLHHAQVIGSELVQSAERDAAGRSSWRLKAYPNLASKQCTDRDRLYAWARRTRTQKRRGQSSHCKLVQISRNPAESGRREYSRLSCSVVDAHLGASAPVSARERPALAQFTVRRFQP